MNTKSSICGLKHSTVSRVTITCSFALLIIIGSARDTLGNTKPHSHYSSKVHNIKLYSLQENQQCWNLGMQHDSKNLVSSCQPASSCPNYKNIPLVKTSEE
ncbi:unnamed protein product [Orchesella dallaii]|uniref:Uncharacterized protein n=1 Tax=Orchesella dallaii TaxID=48710 RepID=A0ABP1Q8G8_9HEXA